MKIFVPSTYLVDSMCLKRRRSGLLLMTVLTIFTLHLKETTSKPSMGNSNSGHVSSDAESTPLGEHCLDLPKVGDPSFRSLILGKCYVDKTEYLDKIMKIGEKNHFLSRPRRFGKTLLVDTMEKFFEGERNLFNGTEIYRRLPSTSWSTYPTVRLDLSRDISIISESKFDSSLADIIVRQAKTHNIHLISKNFQGMTGEFIEQLKEKYNSNVVILVDEYDSPYIDSFARGDMNETAKILGILQSFFKTLKDNYKYIQFCFVTGVTRLALSDFFSGFNAAIDLTMDEDYAGIVGFNGTELHKYFGNQIKDVAIAQKKTEDTIIENMRLWNDGFQFTPKRETLYSPCSIFGYLRTKARSTTSYTDTGGPSKFLSAKLKEFPKESLKLILEHHSNRQAVDGMVKTGKLLEARKAELTGKIDFEERDYKSLIALLFHSGYLSIESHDPETDIFTLKFTNLELEEDYSARVANIILKVTSESPEDAIVNELEAFHWESFIKELDKFNTDVPYYLTTNLSLVLEAWFQFILRIIVDRAYKKRMATMEDSTNKGRADIVYCNDNTTFIFKPKMSDNPENPVYQCKEKYLKKYLFSSKKGVVCIGLKFLTTGKIDSWGVANFSNEGKLLTENGPIRLTFKLSSEEQQNVLNQIEDYKKKNPKCSLKPEKVIEFLEQIGPTTEDQLVFVKKITEDAATLCPVLEEIKQLVPDNLRYIINSFVEAVERNKKREKLEKERRERKEKAISDMKKILEPVEELYASKNAFPMKFEDFTEFIYRCEQPGNAALIVSAYTTNIPDLLKMLQISHAVIQDKYIKNRITHIQKSLKIAPQEERKD